MRALSVLSGLFVTILGAAALSACAPDSAPTRGDQSLSEASAMNGPGPGASDARVPELGASPAIAKQSKISMADGIAQAEKEHGAVIEAKFELNDDGKLSLSLYPLGAGVDKDAERNVFQELAGDPTTLPFTGSLEVFADQEHLTRSARDLTLMQLSYLNVADAVAKMPNNSFVYWAIPTSRYGVAGYGVYYLTAKNKSKYVFVDGLGDWGSGWDVWDFGSEPGEGATDARVPELGDDLSVVLQSKISMADALDASEKQYGPAIEAKYEIGDDGKLSLSIYPVKDIDLDAERNTFQELAGDPTVTPFEGSLSTFAVPDAEHLTRSARDLTLVQTASLTLRDAVDLAEWVEPGGFVFWAIPTIRETRSGYGVYVYGKDKKVHYFFIS